MEDYKYILKKNNFEITLLYFLIGSSIAAIINLLLWGLEGFNKTIYIWLGSIFVCGVIFLFYKLQLSYEVDKLNLRREYEYYNG